MIRKKIILISIITLGWFPFSHAQYSNAGSHSKCTEDKTTLFNKLSTMEKKIDWFNVYLNMQGSFNVFMNDSREEETAFQMNQLRLEIKGNITDRVFYRYRQRLNRNNTAQSLDNLPNSIDYAGIGFHLNDKFSIFVGKQCTAFGGFEFDLNPIDVYQYSDLLDHMSNFLTGIDFSYKIFPKHELRFQIVDSRNESFRDFYGKVPEGIKAAKSPLGYTLNWNGNMFDQKLKTRWSASIFHESQKKNWYYYALGTEINLSNFVGFFDFMYSCEDIDRTGIISQITATDGYDVRALDTRYLSLVWRLHYQLSERFGIWAKGMYETAKVKDEHAEVEKGKYRTSWGYMGGVEYYPLQDNHLHFFLNYIGRSYDYTDRAKAFGVANSNPQRISLGFVYQLPMF